jgi:hypothetical protein
MSEPLPVYNPDEPAHPQETDWDCSVESTEWALYSWGRTPSDDWIENSMIAAGVVDPAVGCLDASGAGLAGWCNAEYGMYGYVASNDPSPSFDDIAFEAGTYKHPIMLGGRGWYHWTGVRGYRAGTDTILLANPADGWMGVYQELSRGDWDRLGPWSMVRLTHPAAEGQVPTEPDPPAEEIDYTPWEGFVGSGLLDMMRADGVVPAQSISTWLPLGSPSADIEECVASDGCVYRWLLAYAAGYRYRPS